MESEKLWVDKSIVLEPSAAKMKKLGVPIRKIKKDVMKKHLSDNETQTVLVAGSHIVRIFQTVFFLPDAEITSSECCIKIL